jgi:inhibitor of cysteine peptidase
MKYLLAALACIFTACASPAPKPAPAELALSDLTGFRAGSVAKGGVVTVTLAGNRTTGYAWVLLSGNDAVLMPASEVEYAPVTPSIGQMGAGGNFIFKFAAVNSGMVTLKFGYQRPWEKDVPPVKTDEVTVTVQ